MISFFIIFTVLVRGLATEVVHITLSEGKLFAKLGERETVLECLYELKEGQSTRSIHWYHDDQFVYAWFSNSAPKLGPNQTEAEIQTTRTDGHLGMWGVTKSKAGLYRCDVTTSTGDTLHSEIYQLLIVDLPNTPFKSEVKVENCSIFVSFEAPAIYPKPLPVCGAYTKEHKYLFTATEWSAIPYGNTSISYVLDKQKIEIRHLPREAIIRCEIGITKVNKFYVEIMSREWNVTELWERGCHPDLGIDDTKSVNFENIRYTCRNEIKSKNNKNVMAHIRCKDHLTPKYKHTVEEITLECIDDQWKVAHGKTWNHHDNLICVEPEDVIQQPRHNLPEIEKPTPVRGNESSSANGNTLSLALCFGLGAAVSYCIWMALKTRKSRRYVE